jgi:hypothetical protein
VISNPEKFDSVLLGSSRVGSIHVENINGLSMYNMTYSCGTPCENLDTLKALIDEGVMIKTVLMGIDSCSYTMDSQPHLTEGLRSPYQYLSSNPVEFCKIYINPTMVVQSLSTILGDATIEGYDAFYDYGWWCDYDSRSGFDWNTATASMGSGYYMDDSLEAVREIKEICDANGIEFNLFINPMHELTYRASVERYDFYGFLERLVQISPYYNFSGINDVTIDNSNFLDTSHYNAYVGDMIIDVIFNNTNYDSLYAQGFGWYVTEDNIGAFIDLLQSS